MNGEVTVEILAQYYLTHLRPVGLVIGDEVVEAMAVKATRFYEGFGELSLSERYVPVTKETLLDKSEWAVISPLFELYVERENALILESSRALGVEVYGRTVSEINNDIVQKEQEIQNLAFQEDFITIG